MWVGSHFSPLKKMPDVQRLAKAFYKLELMCSTIVSEAFAELYDNSQLS